MAKSKKRLTPMERLTAGYEKLMKGKQQLANGRTLFDKTVKRASKKKSK